MPVLESRIDTNSDDYKANYDHTAGLVEKLNEELTRAHEDRSDKGKARNAELGKLTVTERLDKVLDRNSPFMEIAPLAAWEMYDGRIHGAGSRHCPAQAEQQLRQSTASSPTRSEERQQQESRPEYAHHGCPLAFRTPASFIQGLAELAG